MKKTHWWGLGGLVAGLLIGKMGGIRNVAGRL